MNGRTFVPCLILVLVLPPTTGRASANFHHVSAAVYVSAPLSVKITCQSEGPNGPTITARLLNVGSKPFDVMATDPIAIVDLTVIDESGKPVVPGSGRDGILYRPTDRILRPGQSLDVTKYAGPDSARNPNLPIADWGYRNLGSGTYTVTATATEPAAPALSSRCTITVK